MAKNPNSIQDERKVQKNERKLAAKKEELKKSRQHKAIFIGIIAVLLAFAALLIYNKFATNGSKERNTVVASTENFEVSQSMMTYYFNTLYNSFANSYSQDQENFKKFVEDVNNRDSNYDFIMSYAKSQAEQYLTLCEMAKEAGVELDKEDYEAIDSAIDSYKETQLSYGQNNNMYSLMTFDKFLETIFGESVNEDVVRECLELNQLAAKYQEEVTEGMTYTDEECEKYFEEHKDDYEYVDYLTYTFTKPAETTEDTTDTTADTTEDTAEDTTEDTAADTTEDTAEDTEPDETPDQDTPNEAEAAADELAAKTSAEEFNAYMTEYLTKKAEASLAEGEEVDAENIKTQVEGLAKTKQLKSAISGDGAKEWAFADDAKVGSTYVSADEEAGTYVVYMLTATPYRDEELTRSAAVLTLSDSNYDGDSSAKAEEIVAEWEKSDKTEEAFIELCEKYSESSHHHVEEGYTKSNSGEISDWLFDESRKDGEVGIVRAEENATATYIVYCAGEGDEAWKSSVINAKRNEDFTAKMEEYQKAHAVDAEAETPSAVTFDENALKNVKPISLSVSSN